jgi:hypothetical protein
VLLALLLPVAANAAEYKLAFGSRYALCRDLQRNLITFNNAAPMVCGIRFRSRFKKFRLPDWQAMKVRENLALLKEAYIIQNLHRGGYTPEKSAKEWNKNEPRLLKRIESGKVHLSRARFDFDNDGDPETVVKLSDQGCNPANASDFFLPVDPTLFVLSSREHKLDPTYAKMGSFVANAFFYEGRTFIARWRGKALHLGNGTFYIYEPRMPSPLGSSLALMLVCKYDYLK